MGWMAEIRKIPMLVLSECSSNQDSRLTDDEKTAVMFNKM